MIPAEVICLFVPNQSEYANKSGPPHRTIFPTTDTVPFALNVKVHEFPVLLSEDVHAPTMLPAVPLERVHVISDHVMVVAVIITPVSVSEPSTGPSHTKFELVQFQVITRVVEFQVYVPLAVRVTAVADGVAEDIICCSAGIAVVIGMYTRT